MKCSTKNTDKATKAHSDSKLIAVCVKYGFTMGGANSAFRIDPTDGEFAASIDGKHMRRGAQLIIKAAGIKATTLDGLAAKARLAQAARKLTSGSAFDCATEALLLESLVSDVCRFHEVSGGGRVGAPTAMPFKREGDENGVSQKTNSASVFGFVAPISPLQ